MAGESFTKPDPPKLTVDQLREMLDGTVPVTRYVELLLKPGLQGEIEQLQALADRAPEDEAEQMLDRAENLRSEMEASRVGFKLRRISDAQFDDIRKRHKGDDLAVTYAVLAEQCIEPDGLRAADFRRITEGAGSGYASQTLLATSLAIQQGIGVSVPPSSSSYRRRGRKTLD